MKCIGVILGAIVTVVTTGSAQQPSASQPLDVVSITPSAPGPPQGGPMAISPGRVELRGATLKALIRQAYSRFPFDPRQAVGGPSWTETDRFDVIATLQRPLQAAPNGMPTELFAIGAAIKDLVEGKSAWACRCSRMCCRGASDAR
jgi:hypothetical protein